MRWLESLYVMYADELPVNPQDIGISLEWHEVIESLLGWIEAGHHWRDSLIRQNRVLNFDSTLLALKNSQICARYRDWLWKQVCLYTQGYSVWNVLMPESEQLDVLHRLEMTPSLRERFNLRETYAALGH